MALGCPSSVYITTHFWHSRAIRRRISNWFYAIFAPEAAYVYTTLNFVDGRVQKSFELFTYCIWNYFIYGLKCNSRLGQVTVHRTEQATTHGTSSKRVLKKAHKTKDVVDLSVRRMRSLSYVEHWSCAYCMGGTFSSSGCAGEERVLLFLHRVVLISASAVYGVGSWGNTDNTTLFVVFPNSTIIKELFIDNLSLFTYVWSAFWQFTKLVWVRRSSVCLLWCVKDYVVYNGRSWESRRLPV